MIKLSTIKSNPNNPRVIKDDNFKKLVKSIKEFPKMMELRPMVVNSEMVVLGGNMRLKALKEAGYTEVPKEWIKSAESLTEDEQRRFIIADNIGFGDHDWGVLRADWDVEELALWGLDVPDFVDDEADKEDDNNEAELDEHNEPHQEVQQTNMIAISLTDEEYKLWFNSKEKLKINNDKKALFELIKKFENESSTEQ